MKFTEAQLEQVFIELLEQLKEVAIEGTIEDEIRPIFS